MIYKKLNHNTEHVKTGDVVVYNDTHYLICERENDGFYLLNINNGLLVNTSVYDSVNDLLSNEGLLDED